MKRTLIIFIFFIITFLLISCNFNNILIKNITYIYNNFYVFDNGDYYIKIIHLTVRNPQSDSPIQTLSKTIIEIIPLKVGLVEKTHEIKFKNNIIVPKLGNYTRSLVAETSDFLNCDELEFYSDKAKIDTKFTSINSIIIRKDDAIALAENKIKEYMKKNKIRKLEGDFRLKIIESELFNYSYYIDYLVNGKLFALVIDGKSGKILSENFTK